MYTPSNTELMVGYGRNSNSSEIVCLSCLPANLKILSKLKALSCPQLFIISLLKKVQGSSASNSKVNGPIWLEDPF